MCKVNLAHFIFITEGMRCTMPGCLLKMPPEVGVASLTQTTTSTASRTSPTFFGRPHFYKLSFQFEVKCYQKWILSSFLSTICTPGHSTIPSGGAQLRVVPCVFSLKFKKNTWKMATLECGPFVEEWFYKHSSKRFRGDHAHRFLCLE